MKRLLKRILPGHWIVRLVRWREAAATACGRLIAALLRLTPLSVATSAKSGLRYIRRMDYPRGEILLVIDSREERGIRLHSCKKEPETIQWIETFFREGDVFFDVGANVGAYSLVAASFLRDRIHVYAFEPAAPNFLKLVENIALNRCQDIITPLPVALSDQTSTDVFHYQNLTPGGSLHALGEPVDWKGEVFRPVYRQMMLAFRLDELIQRFHLPVPNHIKIDVDGTEPKILAGAAETLKDPRLRSILIEVEAEGSPESREIQERMEAAGFSVHSKHRYLYGKGGPFENVHNYIFLRN